MNNDRFDDALRRKLEEVNPPFQEKNWTQLQRFMGSQGFPPSIWRSPVNWLQPALTAAAAASLLVVSIWQFRTNQALTDRIQTLTSTVSRLEQVQTTLQQTVTNIASQSRADTVYVVQRIPVTLPAQGQGEEPARTTLAPDEAPAGSVTRDRLLTRTRPLTAPSASERWATAPTSFDRSAQSVSTEGPGALPTGLVANGQREAGNVSRAVPTQSTTTEGVTRSANHREPGVPRAASVAVTDERLAQSIPDQSLTPTTSAPHETPVYATPTPADRLTKATPSRESVASASTPGASTLDEAEASSPATAPVRPTFLAGVKSIDRPTTLIQSDELAAGWQRRLRRVRYRSPYAGAIPTTSLAATAPDQHSNPPSVRFRMGIGGELTTVQAGAGVYGETVINNRLTVSLGVGQNTWLGVSYSNEDQFNQRVKRDFQKEYLNGNPAGGVMGPGTPIMRPRQVYDISWSSSALVIPVQLGYRLDVGKRLFVTPFVGMNMSINPTEVIDCSYEGMFPGSVQRINIVKERPASTYSSWTLGFGLERQVGPFVAQLSPLATIPTARLNNLNTASMGLRARLYYQF